MSKESEKSKHEKSANAPEERGTAEHFAATAAAAPARSVTDLIATLDRMLNHFIEEENVDTNMTGKERQRLFGAGVRNFGFIEKANDIARENPQFLPPNFSAERFEENIADFEEARQLLWVLQQFQQAVNEFMLIKADVCFRDALRIYGSLREQTRGKVPGAEVLYRTLLTFFRKRRRNTQEEPTQKELERDFMKLIHGHADGEIEIVNEQPKFTGGVHKVVDNVQTGHSAIKETAEAEINENIKK